MGQVILRRDAWNMQAESLLAPTLDEGDPTFSLSELQQSVLSGRSTLFQVIEQVSGRPDALLGWVVVFVEHFGGSAELVLQTGAALQNTSGSFAKAVPEIIKFARSQGCSSVRSHVLVKNSYLGRLFGKQGFQKAEVVYRVVV